MSLIMEVLSKVERESKPVKSDHEQDAQVLVLEDESFQNSHESQENGFESSPLQIKKTDPVKGSPVIMTQQQVGKSKKQSVFVFVALAIMLLGLALWGILAYVPGKVSASKAQIKPPVKIQSASVRAEVPVHESAREAKSLWGNDANKKTSFFNKTEKPLILEGLVLDGYEPYCLIQGKILKVGDWLDDKKVVAITSEGVTLNVSTGDIVFLPK